MASNRGIRLALSALFLLSAVVGRVDAAGPSRWDQLATTVFQYIGHDTGLASLGEPTSFAQDRNGLMWIGSETGLLRWDGYHFTQYNADVAKSGALPDDYIESLHTDRAGRLWIGGNVGGLARYDPVSDRFVRVGLDTGLSKSSVNAIIDDGCGRLWVGGDQGLSRVDARGDRVISTAYADNASSPPPKTVNALLLDHAGRLWVASAGGLFQGDRNGRNFRAVPLAGDAKGSVIPISLLEDSQGRIWIGAQKNGAFLLSPGRTTPLAVRETGAPKVGLATQGVAAIVEVGTTEVWLGTSGHGIVAVDASTLATRHIGRNPDAQNSLGNETILSMARDRSGLVWIATDKDAYLYDPSQSGIKTVFGSSANAGLVGADVRSVAQTPDGHVWIGLGAEGVDVLDPRGGSVAVLRPRPPTATAGLPPSAIYAIAQAQSTVYMGTSQGLFRTTLRGGAVEKVPLPNSDDDARVRSLLHDGRTLWIGYDGLTRLHLGPDGLPVGGVDHLKAGLPHAHVSALASGPGGTVWVGTHKGLSRVDSAMRVLETVLPSTDPQGLGDGGVTSLLVDRKGRLWAGSTGGAINVLQGRNGAGRLRFRHIGSAEGLPNSNVDKLLLAPDGAIWVATDDGLAKIDPDSFKVTPYHAKEGVALNAYWAGSGAVSASGELLFGGVGGLTVVQPRDLQTWAFRPPLSVTRVDVDGKPVSAAELDRRDATSARALQVHPKARSLSVEFAALDYSSPSDNRYAYKLQGYDKDWIETDAAHRVAAYTNLSPGHYELWIRGSNKDGVWAAQTLKLPIDVLPAWYQTLAFKLLLLVIGACGVAGIVFWRTATLRRRQRELERLVEQRTAQLQDQTALALAANQAKSGFLAMMSHELRTPMNGVLGLAHVLRQTALDAQQSRYLEMILKSGDSLMMILNDILDISKIEAGKLEIEHTPFNLREIGQTVFDLWQEVASAKGVLLVYEFEEETPVWVTGDGARVRQIMTNLVSNALKFTAQGQVRLCITASGTGHVVLSVSDTGIGLSPAQQAKLFKSFSQADVSTSRRFGGTGLGLSICKQLSELMGGRVGLTSVEGEGSTFTVDLPLAAVQAPRHPTSAASEADAMPLDGVRVLVVDDNPINLAVAGAVLGSVGAVVTTAADGVEGLSLLREREFDVVLMDLQMPRMSGVEAVEQVRAGAAGRADIPVVALTADVMTGASDKLSDLGFDAVQPKPMEPAHLVETIYALIARSDAGPQALEDAA